MTPRSSSMNDTSHSRSSSSRRPTYSPASASTGTVIGRPAASTLFGPSVTWPYIQITTAGDGTYTVSADRVPREAGRRPGRGALLRLEHPRGRSGHTARRLGEEDLWLCVDSVPDDVASR